MGINIMSCEFEFKVPYVKQLLRYSALTSWLFTAACGLNVTSLVAQQTEPAHPAVVIDNPNALPEASYSLKINDIVVPYSIFSVFVMPGESVEFEILFSQSKVGYQFNDTRKNSKSLFTNRWKWTASEQPGHYPLVIEAADNSSEKVIINAFVKVPAEQVEGGSLNYFQIGHYPTQDEIKNKDLYIVPDGFIEVSEKNKNVKVSPNFTLKEFVSKQRSNYPKYLYLQNKLLLKLEVIRQEMILKGVEIDKMVVMSGYRTPQYNKAIGNVKFSRHVFGDAADIFIDNDGDYRMDDINKDGRKDKKDAEYMASIIESVSKREAYRGLIGGLGVYGPKSHRGGFVHVDTRGIKARWSQ
ncbi:YcbK family protein [Aliiglaciecola litoralis]|uniref:Peptidase M15A C-terminal domain-containing protein n=1 Tax=Aliiglaciecola litoralis TaxID=582857 RepID=A0ABN1LBW4_9ALTE